MNNLNTRKLNNPGVFDVEVWLELMLAFFLAKDAVMKVFAFIFFRLGNPDLGIYTYIYLQYGLTVACLLRFHVPMKRWGGFLFIWMAAACGFLLSFMAHPEYEEFFTRPVYGVLHRVFRPERAIYAYLFFRLCRRPERVLGVMQWVSYILTAYHMWLLLDARAAGGWEEYDAGGEMTLMNYSLVYGYQVLFPAAVFTNDVFAGRKSSVPWFLACVVQVILGGSRGPMLLLVGYCGLLLIRNWKRMPKLKYLIVLLLAFLGFLLSDAALTWLESLGEHSRTIRMLLEGSISDDNGRDALQTAALELIKTGGPFGWGIYGDRAVLSQYHFAGYPHNLFLELLTNYGWLLGGLMCVIICFDIIRMIIFCKHPVWWEIYTILLICAMQLMVSQSYWYVWAFWGAWAVRSNYRDEIRLQKRTIL